MGPHGQIVTTAKSVIKSAHGLYPIASHPSSTRIGPQNILVTHLPSLLFFNCLIRPDDWFDTEGDMVLDSTVLVVDEDNITDCGVNDDQEMIED